MFKRFLEAPPSKENSNNTTQRESCEEGWRKTGSKGGEQDTNRQASNMVTRTQASTTAFEPDHDVNQLIDFLLPSPPMEGRQCTAFFHEHYFTKAEHPQLWREGETTYSTDVVT